MTTIASSEQIRALLIETLTVENPPEQEGHSFAQAGIVLELIDEVLAEYGAANPERVERLEFLRVLIVRAAIEAQERLIRRHLWN